VGLVHSSNGPRHHPVHYECSPLCYSNELPLAQKSKLSNNPKLSNKEQIEVKSVLTAQSTQFLVLVPSLTESNLVLNIEDIDKFLSFSTVIYTS
jgi:hypothetical protein